MQKDQVLKIELAIKDNILKTYHFTQDVVDIGRIPTADIFIDNSGISRQHTRIERSIGGPYIVKDMGSTNGTYLNDIQINEAALNSNDVISLGKFSLYVTIVSDEKTVKKSVSASPDDFDGTTVLSPEQLARLRAEIVNDASSSFDRKPAGNKAKSRTGPKDSGLSLSQILIWGALAIALIVIVALLLK
jgi:pSer/pThr/pTyr-binding forkhead associated (FHA) protein